MPLLASPAPAAQVSHAEILVRHHRGVSSASTPAAPLPEHGDFRLYASNSLEVLAGLLADELRQPNPGAGLLTPDTIVIQQASMRRWLQNTLAQTHGIAANLKLLTPGEFVRDALDANVPIADQAIREQANLDAANLQWRLYAALRDPAARRHPALASLASWLSNEANENGEDALRTFSLATELAAVFEKYQAWRRDWLRGWEAGRDPDDWQAELWRRVARGLPHRARRIGAYLQRFATDKAEPPRGLPSRLFVFACTNVSPDVLRVLASQSRVGVQHFYLPTPSRVYWGDLQSLSTRLRALPSEQDDASLFDAEDNPLLQAWGAAGRDFIATMASYETVHPSAEIEAFADPEDDPGDNPANESLLKRLQRDLLHRRAPQDVAHAFRAEVNRNDPSLQIHACHTRLREVQVLHDQLRALLESEPGQDKRWLEPREIVVLMPDIDAYLPAIDAVFGAAGSAAIGQRAASPIPWMVADGSLLAGEPLAGMFLRLLALPQSRFAVDGVLELLAVPAIAEHLDLDQAGWNDLQRWLREAGVRWGLDARHRAQHDAPPDAAFTWQFALDRLLLGHASGEDAMIAGVAPWPELEGGSLHALDALIRMLHVLARAEHEFAECATALIWQQRLLRLLDDLLPETPREPHDRAMLQELREAIETFREQATRAELSATLPLAVVRNWFRTKLTQADARAPFLSGGVTFCRMVPMRLIPFRVICVLGMDDGALPRRDPVGSLNRLAAALGTPQRQRGDRSLREDDRFLFLQLFAAAGEVFYLSYRGADARDNSRREPSVLVSELLDVAASYHADPDSARKQLVVHHSLQPFSAQAFGAASRDESTAEPRRFSYQSQWLPGASSTDVGRAPQPPFVAAPLAVDASEANVAPIAISLAALRAFLRNPPQAFLRQSLRLHLFEAAEQWAVAEPFDTPVALRKHALQKIVLDACLSASNPPDNASLHAELVARALLPTGASGLLQLAALRDQVQPYADALVLWRNGAQPASATFDLALEGWQLSGTLDGLYPHGLARVKFGPLDGNAQLRDGTDWLLLSALGDGRPLVQISEVDGVVHISERAPIAAPQARAALEFLLTLRERGLLEPLPFLPRSGFLLAQDASGKGLHSAEKKWTGDNGNSWAEGGEAGVQLALRARDPFFDADSDAHHAFIDLSQRIFAAVSTGEILPEGRAA
ncbi:MAG: exodeoxyribonuclease V subunit gamma [Lysobacteraceae bacterium]